MPEERLTITILGVEEADAYLTRLHAGCQTVGRTSVQVGTSVVYAHGIEFGRRRSGRLARAAGGALMLTGALEAVMPSIGPTLADALPNGDAAADKALLGLGYKVEAIAKARTPVRSGHLRRSIHTVQGPR